MNYSVEMALGDMIYIPGFINVSSCVHIRNTYVHRHRQKGYVISLLLFSQNKEGEIKAVPLLN
jgi:hypothetical protein